MNSKQIINDTVQWDCFNWKRALDFWQQQGNIDFNNCKALEIGANSGGISLWLALQGAQVTSTDLQDHFPTEAQKLHEKYGVSHLVDYKKINALDMDYENKFDLVVFKSVIGSIGHFNPDGGKAKVIQKIHQALKKDGQVWFAENLTATTAHNFCRKHLAKRLTWDYCNNKEIKEIFNNFNHLQTKNLGFLGTFGRSESQRNILGRLDKYLFEPVIPNSWKYIAAGVATK